jgi:hypothetical protein
MSIRDEVSSYLADQGYSATEIEKVVTCLAGKGNGGLTLKQARDVRSGVWRAKLAAMREGRIEEATSFSRVYDSLTEAMRSRATELGMTEDFDKADYAWRAIEKDEGVLDPLLSVRTDSLDGAKAFEKAWQNRTPEMRAALKDLGEHGGLDLNSLDEAGKRAEVLLRNLEATKRMTWFERKPHLSAVLVLLVAAVWCGVTWRDQLRLGVALGTTVLIEGYILWGPVGRLLAKVRALESIANLETAGSGAPERDANKL